MPSSLGSHLHEAQSPSSMALGIQHNPCLGQYLPRILIKVDKILALDYIEEIPQYYQFKSALSVTKF